MGHRFESCRDHKRLTKNIKKPSVHYVRRVFWVLGMFQNYLHVLQNNMETTYTPELDSYTNKKGERAILIRISKNRQHSRISINISVTPLAWDKSRHCVLESYKGYKLINKKIAEKIKELQDLDGKNSKEIRRKAITGSRNGTFFDFCDTYLLQFNNSGTYDAKKAVISKLKEYKALVEFEDITKDFLLRYIKFLREIKKNGDNTIQKNISVIKTIYNDAIDDEVFKSNLPNPFRKLHLPTHESYRDRLSFNDIEMIEKLELVEGSVHYHARNLFLLQYYTYGCRITDMLMMKFENIKGEHFAYKTSKNNKIITALITSKAEKIIEIYKKKGIKSKDYIFPFMKNYAWDDHREYKKEISSKTALINKSLKIIAEKAGINKNLHTHVSRHSFAENARIKSKGDTFNVSKALGHSKIATTEGYLSQGNIEELDNLARLVYS